MAESTCGLCMIHRVLELHGLDSSMCIWIRHLYNIQEARGIWYSNALHLVIAVTFPHTSAFAENRKREMKYIRKILQRNNCCFKDGYDTENWCSELLVCAYWYGSFICFERLFKIITLNHLKSHLKLLPAMKNLVKLSRLCQLNCQKLLWTSVRRKIW